MRSANPFGTASVGQAGHLSWMSSQTLSGVAQVRYTSRNSAPLYTMKSHLAVGDPMCGRFTMATNTEVLEARFHAHLSTEPVVPTYNAAPSQAQLTVLNDHPQAIVRATWGFVPAWADGRPDV